MLSDEKLKSILGRTFRRKFHQFDVTWDIIGRILMLLLILRTFLMNTETWEINNTTYFFLI